LDAARKKAAWTASLPAAGVVVMEDVSSREGDDPKADDEAANGDDPLAGGAIMGGEGGGFADAEDLSADANHHQKGAENEGEPSHG
jgi:hypothetical protein